VRKEIIWNVCMFVVLVAGFAMASYIFKITSFQSMAPFRSGALAVLPLILFNLLNYNRSLKNKMVHLIDSGRQWLAEDRKNEPPVEKEVAELISENGKEAYSGGLKNIILIQSSSNYIEIIYREGRAVRRQLIRQTLTKAEMTLSGLPNFMKCHRCMLVNIDQINKITGKLPNVTLEADGLDFQIPVSRQRVNVFKKALASR